MINFLKQRPLMVLDFGSQYTQLIARRIRELGVYCEIHPYDIEQSLFDEIAPCGVILSGGPSSTVNDGTPKAPSWLFLMDIPLLGICYGMQTMAAQLGGEVQRASIREYGAAEICLLECSDLFHSLESLTMRNGDAFMDVWMSHGDKVTGLPPGFKVICTTPNAPIAGMADEKRRWYGLQFHPEVTHTNQGFQILQCFLFTVCHAQRHWTPSHIIEQSIAEIRQKVGHERVILGLSGGVDSSVVAMLLHRAIGDQLIAVFVDTGLLRLNEVEHVRNMFEGIGIHIIFVDAQEQFLSALQGVDSPEAKRKVIGRVFIDIFEQQAQMFEHVQWLAQGTIYPDVIESAATSTNKLGMVIKSHHNVGGLPEKLHLKLLEPIRELFKDEVRALGLALNLPYRMIYRHPFPGPGLAIRILGEIKKEYVVILRQADAIFIEALENAGLYDHVSQAFAVFLPVKSVGVLGDERHYDYVICLRAVESIDFMTAHWSKLPWDFLAEVSHRITNEVRGVSRVTYDISNKPPATIEWE